MRLPLLSQACRDGIESRRHEIHEPLLVLIALEANVALVSQSQHQRDDLAQAFLPLDQEHVTKIEARPLALGREVEAVLFNLHPMSSTPSQVPHIAYEMDHTEEDQKEQDETEEHRSVGLGRGHSKPPNDPEERAGKGEADDRIAMPQANRFATDLKGSLSRSLRYLRVHTRFIASFRTNETSTQVACSSYRRALEIPAEP